MMDFAKLIETFEVTVRDAARASGPVEIIAMGQIADSARQALFDAVAGMTLRDWFAGQAPVTLLDAVACCGWSSLDDAGIGQDSVRSTVWAIMTLLRYEYADAMLAERAVKGGDA